MYDISFLTLTLIAILAATYLANPDSNKHPARSAAAAGSRHISTWLNCYKLDRVNGAPTTRDDPTSDEDLRRSSSRLEASASSFTSAS